MVGKRNAQLLKHMDVIEDNICLVDADGNNVAVAIGGGAQLLQSGSARWLRLP